MNLFLLVRTSETSWKEFFETSNKSKELKCGTNFLEIEVGALFFELYRINKPPSFSVKFSDR